ncbi:MAG: CoA-binding protein [Clostridiales bacterium]|nr:CoA-binding protein [Clostridiales bacterium]
MDFEKIKNIAVVGLSANPERPSYNVAKYLQEAGYNVIPVNPTVDEVLGEKSYPDLLSIPKDIDIDVVDIFRRSEAVPPIVDEALARGTKVIWMQEGVVNQEAAKKAENAGVEVIMDKCIKKEHAKYRL